MGSFPAWARTRAFVHGVRLHRIEVRRTYYDPGQESGFAQDLDGIADAEHKAIVPRMGPHCTITTSRPRVALQFR